MKTFKQYLLSEAAKANTHLTHLEELVLKKGDEGYKTARKFIIDLLNHLETNSGKVGTTVKWDGAPAIFTGINPDNGKFFVGTKSIFNINPKFNYTDQDVDLNHGNAPGLANKLKKALRYLPELGIKNILQGDFMFDESSIKEEVIDGVEHYTFKPNTIKYAVEVDSELGQKIASSKFGVIFHTEYDDLAGGARFGAKVETLNPSKDVWYDDAFFKDDTGIVTLTDDESKHVKNLLDIAESIKVNYNSLPLDLINIYTNVEIRDGEYIKDPEASYNGFVNFIENRKNKEVEKRKSEAGKIKVSETYDKLLSTLVEEKNNIINLFKISKILSEAKQIFINKYNNAVYKTKHFIDAEDGTLKVTSPEGYVSIDSDGNAVKLVDRLEFSRANFMAGKPGNKPGDEENYVTNPPIFNTGEGTRLQKRPTFGEMYNILKEFEDAEDLTKTVVIYPGRFHPFHKGHASVYNKLKQQFPTADVFITTSEKTDPEKSPFSYEEKERMIQSSGIDPTFVEMTKNPYLAKEIIANYDLEKTKLIFAVSEKDMQGDRPRFAFGLKKDGTPSYFQPFKGINEAEFASKHGYIATLPTMDFKILDKDISSASQIRELYKKSDEQGRRDLIIDLYGSMDEEVKRIFDNKLI
tara:strand:- start:20759 stop:22669 length:1911 start_codon:yes stop_codon:yes gene_type:complete